MPLYEYHCDDCNESFELRRPMSASDEATECPNCDGQNVKRQISVFMAFTKGASGSKSLGGGCACGGACACGGHNPN